MNFYAPDSLIAGRYQVAGRPLLGGMGIVYLCYDHGENRPVALKTFKPEYLPDRAARDRFLREGDTWMKLERHPHVVYAYDVERVANGTKVYLVLELIAKEQRCQDASLRSWLTPGRPLAIEQAMLFTMQVIRGMQHATHKIPGFVHRDLKPENLLVGSDKLTNANINRLRVTDLGLASVLGELRGVGQVNENDTVGFGRTQLTHGTVGTPLYMAAEQWRGEPVSAATDIYALGCIVFEMLTGERAVNGSSLSALEQAHHGQGRRSLAGNVPGELRAWVERCLQVSPLGRFGSWAEAELGLGVAYGAVMGGRLPEAEAAVEMGRLERIARGWAQNAMGASYLDIGKAGVARDYFERAADVAMNEGDKRLEGVALGNLGLAYSNIGDVARSLRYHEESLKIARIIGDRYGEGHALTNLGTAYAHLGEVRRAISYHEQRLQIAQELEDRHGEGHALGGLGIAYYRLGELRRAIRYYEQHLTIAREIGDRRGEGDVLGNLGLAYAELGEAYRAIGYHEQHLTIAREVGDRRGEGAALGNLGYVFQILGEFMRALGYQHQALVIYREIGDRRAEGDVLGNLGIVYREMGDPQRAIGYYEQCLDIHRETGDRRGEGKDLTNLGTAYLDLGEIRHAIDYFEESLEITRTIGDRQGEANALTNLGTACNRSGEMQRAISYFERGLAVNAAIGNEPGEAIVSFNFAVLYHNQGETAKALFFANHALTLFRQLGSPNTKNAELLIAALEGSVTSGDSAYEAEIRHQFGPLIEVIVLSARGDKQARAAVEEIFPQLTEGGLQIVEPIKQIWQGERNESKLAQALNQTDAFIVHEILVQLK